MAVKASMEIQTAIEKLTMQVETTAKELAEIKSKSKWTAVNVISKLWPVIVVAVLVIIGYTRLQDKVEANEKERVKDIETIQESIKEFKTDFKEMRKDIKEILTSKNK